LFSLLRSSRRQHQQHIGSVSAESSRHPTPRLIPNCQSTRPCTRIRHRYLRVASATLSATTPCQLSKSKTTAAETTLAHTHHRRRIPALSAGWRGTYDSCVRVHAATPNHNAIVIPYLAMFDAQTFISECRSSYGPSMPWLGAKSTSPASSNKICAAPPVGKHFLVLSTSESYPFNHRAPTPHGSRSRES